jgi:hypothetical protein
MVAENPTRKRKAGERGPVVPVLLKLKARHLYLNEGLPCRAISQQTGVDEATLYRMASREGWTAVRREQKNRLIQRQDMRGDEIRKQAEEAIAERATLIASKALTVTEAGLDQGDLDGAKQAQAASSALKNLVTSARVLQSPIGSVGTESGPQSFNLFFVGSPPKNSPGEPKQVTEVEAKSV